MKSGKLKALGAAGARKGRPAALPDVPTIAEQTGDTDFTGYTWNILVAPRGTPPEVVAKLNAAVNEMAKKPEIREKLAGLGLQPLPGSDKDTADFVAREIAKNRKTIEATGIKRE